MMKIEISVPTNELIDTLGIAWLKEMKENNKVNIEMAIMEEDADASRQTIEAIDVLLTYLGADDDRQI